MATEKRPDRKLVQFRALRKEHLAHVDALLVALEGARASMRAPVADVAFLEGEGCALARVHELAAALLAHQGELTRHVGHEGFEVLQLPEDAGPES